MDVRIPSNVAQTARDLALGQLIGRYPQAGNGVIRILCWVYAAPLGYGALGVIPHFPGFGPLGLPLLNAVLLAAGATLLFWLAARVKRHRVIFLYVEGVITVSTWGRIRLSTRWEDVQMSASRVRTYVNGGYFGTSHRYELSVLGKTKLRHGSWRPGGLGQLMMATAAAAKTRWSLEQLRSGKKVSFGPVTAEPRGVVFVDRTYGNNIVVPWAQLALWNDGISLRIGTFDRRTAGRYVSDIPDNAVLLNLVSAVKADPSALTPTS